MRWFLVVFFAIYLILLGLFLHLVKLNDDTWQQQHKNAQLMRDYTVQPLEDHAIKEAL